MNEDIYIIMGAYHDNLTIAIYDDNIDKKVFPHIKFQDSIFPLNDNAIVDKAASHATSIASVIINKLSKYNDKVTYINCPLSCAPYINRDERTKEFLSVLDLFSTRLIAYNFVNVSLALPKPCTILSANLEAWQRSYITNDLKGVVFVAAGNNESNPGTEFMLQNIPYTINVGAVYYKKNTFDKRIPIMGFGEVNTSCPSTGVQFAEMGSWEVYNTVTENNTTQAYYQLPEDQQEWFMTYHQFLSHPREIRTLLEKPKRYVTHGSSFSAPSVLALFAEAALTYQEKALSKHDYIDIAMFAAEIPDLATINNSWRDKNLANYFRSLKTNASAENNGVGYKHTLEFGYGVINKQKFFALAKDWHTRKDYNIQQIEVNISAATKNAHNQFEYTLKVEESFKLQQLVIAFQGAGDQSMGDINTLEIIAPSGTRSVIFDKVNAPHSYYDNVYRNTNNQYFEGDDGTFFTMPLVGYSKTVQFWGEVNTKGQWKIISDCPLDLALTKLKMIGNFSKDNRYNYDDNILSEANPAPLTDINGGEDVVYFTNYTQGKVVVNERKRQIDLYKNATIAKSIKIAQGTDIEKFVFGIKGGSVIKN